MSDLTVLRGRRILLGITGGIGAYKSAELARSFIRHGAQVSVVMTQSATRFISPLTMEALTHNPVGVDLFSLSEERAISHIERARWADIMVIAPATANYLAKSALGIADDLVTTITLAADCPQVVVPAMNSVMWSHSAVQENLEKIRARGVISVSPGYGELACGEEGPGRMADIEQIVSVVAGCLQSGDLSGIRVLVTAGPTRETIDPVRFLSNRSSGKMGYALVRAAADRGAEVVLITGPTALEKPDRATVVEVITAEEMLLATKSEIEQCDWLIMSAAVSDFKPAGPVGSKIKKEGKEKLVLELTPNLDILKELKPNKGTKLFVGFAAETQDILENAKAKLESKSLDIIVANDVTLEGSGFQSDKNKAQIIGCDGSLADLPLLPKRELADRILDNALEIWQSSG